MSKMRVHELAKSLNVNSKSMIEQLAKIGIDAKNHMSSISSEDAERVSKFFRSNPNASQSPNNIAEKQANSRPASNIKSQKPAEGTSMSINLNENPTISKDEGKAVAAPNQDQNIHNKTEIQKPLASQGDRPPFQSNRPQTQGHPGNRPQGQGYQGDRPQGQGYQGNRPQGQGYQGNRPQGQGYQNNRPQGQGYQGDNSQGQGYQGNRPQGQGYQGNRPQGQGYQGDRPQGQGYQGNRPQGQGYQGNRPQGQGYQGDRPQGQGYQGNRPQGQGYQGNRPQGQGYQGDRPQGQGYQGSRPQGQGYQGNRPQGQGYQGNRPQGDRPQGQGYQGNRPQGDRPQGQGYQGNRPQGQGYQGNRPQGQGYQGNRPQGDRPQGQGYQGNRPQGQGYQGNRPQGQGFQGGYNRGNTIDDKIKALEKSKDKSSSSAVAEKPDKDHSRRLNKPPVKSDRKTLPKDWERPMEKPTLKSNFRVKPEPKPIDLEPKLIQIPPVLTIKQLAEIMGIAGNDVIKALIKKGEMMTLNEEIDIEKASHIAENHNFLVEEEIEIDLFEENFSEEAETEKELKERPPVVVVMGHVDHGKTSLLDSIRNSAVTTGEAGGITQHIGAYTVEINGKAITFLDTPGHEAFTAMRMRGAQVTDIAVLVVAADDGVMPQTIEAINHAKAAGVEIIVAINKTDKQSANPDRVKQELTEYGLVTEEWGGDTICVPVSAMNKTGIDQLLEMIIITAEMKELKANPNKNARGTIIEAELDKGRGPVATVLIQSGTLKIGDPLVAGGAYGKIRAMMDDKGKKVKTAGPSMPVEILGLSEVPQAGDMFYVASSDKHARHVAEAYVAKGRVEMTKSQIHKVSLDDLFSQIQAGNIKELNIVVKADVQGSVEAVRQSLEKLSNDEVRVRILHGGVGAINESDVMLASTSGAIIIGFNVRPEVAAKIIASEHDVDIRLYRVIYGAIEDIQLAMKGMLDPIFEEKIIGHAEIRQIFKASGVGTIGGSYVTDGKFVRNAKARITRNGVNVYTGTIDTLKRFKDDVKEVSFGYECGLLFSKFNDIKEGDLVEAYVIEEVAR